MVNVVNKINIMISILQMLISVLLIVKVKVDLLIVKYYKKLILSFNVMNVKILLFY